ncbi:hypothetical protein [Candidatus Williamhamiltonella defendens]|uniref:Uncharacterized protein n=1 Tax=Candidatus Williamhamiltonella defendens TaxID=138072 RepID=A0A2D3TEW6_9ENTR|nr:hypothetical protein [Candidatus Hamiltonella defensa]ATW34308.1 hypothetical protein BJP43_08630 [Candidatus Hamiltonella defensa]
MKLFSCLNCLRSNRTTKTPIESQKAKTGIWQQFKKFFVGVKNLKTDRKSVVLSRNVAYSKETGKSRAGVASNTLTVESRSKELVNEIKGARESLNLILNSTHSPYAEAAREYEAKGGEYSRAIQTAKNTESLNGIEKSVKAWTQEINRLLNWHLDSMPPGRKPTIDSFRQRTVRDDDVTTRGTNHTSIQIGDNHNSTLVPNSSIGSEAKTISADSSAKPQGILNIDSNNPEEINNFIVDENGKLARIADLIQNPGRRLAEIKYDFGIGKERIEEINRINEEHKKITAENTIFYDEMAKKYDPEKAMELSNQRDESKRADELLEKIKGFTENEKIYLQTISHSCSEYTATLLAHILGIKITFVGKISCPDKDYEPDLWSVFDSDTIYNNEDKGNYNLNKDNFMESLNKLGSIFLVRSGGNDSGHFFGIVKHDGDFHKVDLHMNQIVQLSEKGKPTEEAKTFFNQTLMITPFDLCKLPTMLTVIQNFREGKRE